MKTRGAVYAAIALCGAGLTAQMASAAVITQDPAKGYIAFEAESYNSIIDNDSDGVVWTQASSLTGTSSTSAMLAHRVGDSKDSDLSYSVTFKNAGTYYTFIRYQVNTSLVSVPPENTSGSNQIFYATSFGVQPTVTQVTVLSTNAGWHWARVNLGANAFAVTAGDLNVTKDFRLGSFGAGLLVDRVVLYEAASTGLDIAGAIIGDTDAGYTELEALVNSPIPEPTSMGMLATAGLLLRRRRRTI